MKKPWSISTTVRNPERLRGFLRVLKTLDGEPFDVKNQIKYQILLIQNRVYGFNSPQFYNGLSNEQIELIDDPKRKITYKQAEEIFYSKKYNDPPHRGRESLNPLKKFGFAIVIDSKIKITPLGHYFLREDYDIGEVFFRSFLKWQIPNPDSRGFRAEEGFAIKPFIGTLHLINQVNKKWKSLGHKPVGINKEEFSIFMPTLIDFQGISTQADKLIDFRQRVNKQKTDKTKRVFKKKYKQQFASEFLGKRDKGAVELLIKNLKDYGDNTVRYFRLTRYIFIRGGGFYIDLEPRRSVEINKLLETDNACPLKFKDIGEYHAYISDISQPVLPWETDVELRRIAMDLVNQVKRYDEDLKTKEITFPHFDYREVQDLDERALKRYINELRIYRRKLQDLEIRHQSQNIKKIEECIYLLKNIHELDLKKSIELEKWASFALNALNDALEIRPNYPVGDDNEPTFTAPANKSDIECFYERFNTVCEVTMLTNRSQWYYEGQPVMRHVRDFEDKHPDKDTYCLFVAPRLHQDTAETFWMAIKYGYKGTKQKIVPLTITQFITLVEVLLDIKKQGKRFRHDELMKLYDDVLSITEKVEGSDRWVKKIPDIIKAWKKSILKRA